MAEEGVRLSRRSIEAMGIEVRFIAWRIVI